jgi:hypothetical protein
VSVLLLELDFGARCAGRSPPSAPRSARPQERRKHQVFFENASSFRTREGGPPSTHPIPYDWLEGSDGEVNNDIRLAIYFTLLHELSHVLICAGDEAHDWGRTDPGKSAENYCEIMAPLYPIPNRDRGFWLGFTKPYLTRCLLSDAIGFSDKNKRRILDSVTFLKTEGQ